MTFATEEGLNRIWLCLYRELMMLLAMGSQLLTIGVISIGILILVRFSQVDLTLKRMTGLAAVIAVVVAFWLRGSFLQFVFSVLIIEFFLAPLFLICGLACIFKFVRTRSVSPWMIQGTLFGLVCVGALVISFALSKWLGSVDESNARSFVARVVPMLDAEKKRIGAYPADLNSISNLPSRPLYLRQPNVYKSDGKTFIFSYIDPHGMMDGYCFSSEDRQWHHFD